MKYSCSIMHSHHTCFCMLDIKSVKVSYYDWGYNKAQHYTRLVLHERNRCVEFKAINIKVPYICNYTTIVVLLLHMGFTVSLALL